MNNMDITYTKPTTNLLCEINRILQRPDKLRSPSTSHLIIKHIDEFEKLNINPDKLACIKHLWNNNIVTKQICVCNLANCCMDTGICTYCQEMDNIIQQNDINCDWLSQNVDELTFNMIEHDSKQTTRIIGEKRVNVNGSSEIKYYDKKKCNNGDACYWLSRNCCKYSHPCPKSSDCMDEYCIYDHDSIFI